jgi:phosphoribosylamine--glycine ligase
MASGGYPGSYEKNKVIEGLHTDFGDDVVVFHAGTKMVDGGIVTSGGRVLGVTACANDLNRSIDKAYDVVKQIHFEGAYFRKDIGKKGLNR